MRRIVIIGATGSGKSTLGKMLAEKSGCHYTDLDEIHWLPGWKERPREEFRRLIDEATRGSVWIVAGNYTPHAKEIVWPRADALIWLDMPFWPNFWRIFIRTLARIRDGETVCNGNRETLRQSFFSRRSILWWFIKSHGEKRKKYAAVFARPQDYPHLEMIRLRAYADIAACIESIACE